ncbi:MAG TPA: ATP-dependent helicase HrpB [Polyangiaceae bacterium]|nr:ATP-dependent helicase HrpB [Polyangiaceae bacterium]
MQSLPIDSVLPEVLAALRQPRAPGSLILEAPAGAGKTTRVPAALLGESWCSGQVLVTEPRRIAARLSAVRVAEERGVNLGDEVGYSVRFEERTSARTRLVYLTEGLLLRRLASGDSLAGVSALVFDEVHEQSADLELALALAARAQRVNPALRLVAMSATLDADRLLAHWPGVPRLVSEGRTFPVSLEYADPGDDRALELKVRSAVRSSWERPGDILVFLPGAAEIRRCEEALRDRFEAELVPLHGDLPLEQQLRAVRPGERRRIVLSTNVAESSLTIPAITTVIDSGLARLARHDPWTGISRLDLEEISKARAAQRAGRAGRTQPGHCVRLYDERSFRARPAQETPEILRTNASETLLFLRAAGVDERALELLTPLPEATWQAAERELTDLGALAEAGPTLAGTTLAGSTPTGSAPTGLTDVGRRMADFPLPVRLARVLVEAERLGCADDASLAVALLAERDIVRQRFGDGGSRDVTTVDSDLLERMDRFREAEQSRFNASTLRALELDGAGVRRVEQASQQLRRLTRTRSTRQGSSHGASASSDDPLTAALFAGFWDRVAARRAQPRELLLMNGTSARLADSSGVLSEPFLLCLSADAPRGKSSVPWIRLAQGLDADRLLALGGERVEAREEFSWSAEKERVLSSSALTYGRLVLDESIQNATPGPEAAQVLLRAARAKGVTTFDPERRVEVLAVRLGVLLQAGRDGTAELDDAEHEALVRWVAEPLVWADHALELAVEHEVRLADLQRLDLGHVLRERLPAALTRRLDEWVPEEVTLGGGLKVRVNYEAGRVPSVEARLQNFFGMSRGPSLCRGRMPLQLQLLAPNYRAVQVTTDLEGFWERHYPTLRKELMRRYPKHLWPEDGRTAAPPTPGKIR